MSEGELPQIATRVKKLDRIQKHNVRKMFLDIWYEFLDAFSNFLYYKLMLVACLSPQSPKFNVWTLLNIINKILIHSIIKIAWNLKNISLKPKININTDLYVCPKFVSNLSEKFSDETSDEFFNLHRGFSEGISF